eukprot:TRINITY_DN73529_c0_g1_i1.p1 TRINITY_DN73529_c0_g1~~TRINITY_DN73529_c0_g1_i1.p1  ORF type:complete len:473 (+),score=68.68 TRINITY_DN73529_c0_g1_i1:54-1421(+)
MLFRGAIFILASAYLAACVEQSSAPADLVTNLPGYGPIKGKQYAGMLAINSTYNKHLFYWFVEALEGNVPGKTPLLIWMNGGPGASSITGLLAENIGPINLALVDGEIKLKDNPDTWAREYNILIIDNPVGAGFSYTNEGGHVKTQEEMRSEYHDGLSQFLALHSEYRTNPVWVTGESYGGKYVPNVAFEIHSRGELNLQGVIIGNGMYKPLVQYPTIPDFAYNEGILDEHSYALAKEKISECTFMIRQGRLAEAKVFCEAAVDWMYGSNETGAGQFYYDLGLEDGSFFDDLTAAMGKWLNSPETRAALHVGSHIWVQADEKGPVADALIDDFVTDQSIQVLASLLDATKRYEIVMYNGVRDGSLCNHVGNLLAMNDIPWAGQLRFRNSYNSPFKVDKKVAGYARKADKLSYYTLLRTGHLVPTVVPAVGRALVDHVVGKNFIIGASTSMDHLIV